VRHVLVCAATRAEHGACKRGIAHALEKRTAEHEMLLTGVGPLRAARALAERLSRGPLPDLVVSSGFAGALTGALPLASWITAVRLGEWEGGARIAVDGVSLIDAFPDLVACEVLSASTLVSGSIPCSGAEPVAVDMESVSLAREAARRGVSFAVVRLVSDTPAQPLPAFLSPFTAALAATTTGKRARVALAAQGVRAALGDPLSALRLVADGPLWLRRLEEGWRAFASFRT
jgi:hypothetical protein